MFFSTYFPPTVRSYMDITELSISTYTTLIIDSFLNFNEEYQYTFIGNETSMSTCTSTSPHFFQAQLSPSNFNYKASFPSLIQRLIVLGVYSYYTLQVGVDLICRLSYGVDFIFNSSLILIFIDVV